MNCWCSTPFGIIVRSTFGFEKPAEHTVRAQRLSASLFVPHRFSGGSRRSPGVLNAFRHHCSFHDSFVIVSSPLTQVLNAFRHHCSFHPVVFLDDFRPLDVLNAFRHHCSFHKSARRLPLRVRQCSTPFGIIVRSTGRLSPKPMAVLVVLNAFRHHCSFHAGTSRRALREFSCSTPFGIIVRSTCRPSRPASSVPCRAQRLSASLFVPLQKLPIVLLFLVVLNAFRHHCSFHGLLQSHETASINVLNAFRHHCSFHVGLVRHQLVAVIVLNAFRHHCSFHARSTASCSRIS